MGKDSSQESQESMELRPVRRVEQELVMYEISPDQLTMLKERPGTSACLSLAVFLFTASITLLCAFFANKPQTRIAFDVYVIIIGVTAVGGLLAICLWVESWRKARKAKSDLVERIKQGVPQGTPVQQMEEQDEGQQVNPPPNSS